MNGKPLPLHVAAVFSITLFGLLTSCADRVDVYYTASLNGNLLGCDCWGYPEAGLDKRVWYLKQNSLPDGAILLDAGNILETGRDPYLADMILETYTDLGYHAVSVGTNELTEGIEVLINRSKSDNPMPFFAHNIEVRDDVESPLRLLSADPLIHEHNNFRIAVVALADPEWFAPYLGLFNGSLSVADPSEILENQKVKALKAGAEAVILLAHGSESWIRGLVARAEVSTVSVPIVAVILAGEDKLLEDKLPGGGPLLSPGEEGNRLGILKLRLRGRRVGWKNEFIEFHYLGPGDETVSALGADYAAYLDDRRRE